MSPLKYLVNRITYADAAASLALFMSLGGISYAAIALPEHSVGSKQLRAGAVTKPTLGFPLGAVGATDDHIEDLTKNPCNSPSQPGLPLRTDCPQMRQTGISTPGREVRLRLRSRGEIAVSAIAGLRDNGPSGTSATVTLALVVDGRVVDHAESVLQGGQEIQMPVQLLTRATAGRHTIGVLTSATYSSAASGDIVVSPVSLIAFALPPS